MKLLTKSNTHPALVFAEAAYWGLANLLAPQAATCGFIAKILNEVSSEVPIKPPLNPAPRLNPTYEPWPWSPRASDLFSWRMVFAKFRSVKYDFDLYEILFKEKMAQLRQISKPRNFILFLKIQNKIRFLVKHLFPGEFLNPDFSDKYQIRGFFFSVWNY